VIDSGSTFDTIYGRNLVAELPHFVHRPYLVITMHDLWPKFARFFDQNMSGVHFVETLEHDDLEEALNQLETGNSMVGLGGGQAMDVAKYVSWRRRLPLFQVLTAITVDAAFGHRIAVRFDGRVRYIGWAVPQAVYVDLDVIFGSWPQIAGNA
jgi:glycerol-1-phosphate dehydrogenase [NAD(P)+]